MRLWPRRRRRYTEINPEEILIDSSNVSQFDIDQLEGKIERPIGRRSLAWVGGVLALVCIGYIARAGMLQIVHGAAYAKQAAENTLAEHVLFADRGIITDRNGVELAFNTISTTDQEKDFADRTYSDHAGLAHVLGYVTPPAKDTSGFYFRTSFAGVDGIEEAYNDTLQGKNGTTLTETDARGTIVSESARLPPVHGKTLTLSIDAEITEALHLAIKERADLSGYQGGSGVIIDVQTGELLALTSYPEYAPQDLSRGSSTTLAALLADTRQPFLDRAISGLYAPGSIVKPIMAAAALNEGIIDEHKQILSTGAISIPNPYDASNPTIFKDWKAHGWVDMRKALAVSSDVYFYAIGGGYLDQPGLGIARIETYLRMFGFGKETGLAGFAEPKGTIPNPAWKEATFNGDPWRLGNTYHTAIGQYGVQITPLQAARATAAVANGGVLLTPTLIANSAPRGSSLPISSYALRVAREGMRQAAMPGGTAAALALPFVDIAAKTGTAQVGAKNEFMNSWVIGFFPYENPKYAFAVVLERGPAGTLFGAPAVMNGFFTWMHQHASSSYTH